MNYFRSRLDSRRAAISPRVWLLLMVLLAFALRVYGLGAQAIWWDESLSVYRATRDLGTILANTILIQNVVTHDLQPPLYFVLLHFLVGAFGISEFALRFLSLMANVATVPLLYALARHWLTPLVGLVGALLGALSPFWVWYAQEARPYALVLFWSTLAVYALTRAFSPVIASREAAKQSPNDLEIVSWHPSLTLRTLLAMTHARVWILVYLLAAAASLYTNYYAVFLIPFHFVLIAVLVWRTPRARLFVLLPALPTALAAFLVPLVITAARENVNSGPTFVPFALILRDLFNSFSVGVTMDLTPAVWIDAVLLALFLIGVGLPNSKSTIRDWARTGTPIFLLAYLSIPLLGLAAASFIRPLYQNSRYFIALSPAFYFGVAAGIVALAQRWRVLAVPALGVFLIGAALSLNNWYFDPRFGKDDHRAWADFLREHARPGDFLILDSPHTETLYHYYADDIVPMTTLPVLRADHVESPAQDLEAVRDAYTRNARVWFLAMDTPFDDPQARIDKLLNQEGALIDRTEFRGTSTEIALSLFLPKLPIVETNAIQHSLDIGFAGHLHLRGYAAPLSITPGQHSLVTLYWQIDEPVGEDYAVSLRLIDSAGARVGQWDAIALGNRAGSSTWQPGTILADAQDLIVANISSGTYRLQVVPYHSATGAALGDAVILGEIQCTSRAAQ